MQRKRGIRTFITGAIAVTAMAATGGLAGCTGAGTAAPRPAASGASTASSTPAASTASPPPSGPGALPTNCDDLFTPGLRERISPDGSLALNPAWLQEPGNARKPDDGYGTLDPVLAQTLSTHPGLVCDWTEPSGPGDAFLTTQVRAVDAATQQSALARMEELAADPASGWTCIDYEQGRWCLVNTNDGRGNIRGESQFFRDGMWIASDWVNAGPEGYTSLLLQRIFG